MKEAIDLNGNTVNGTNTWVTHIVAIKSLYQKGNLQW